MNGKIVFKGKKDGITVMIDEEISFEDLKLELKEKVCASKDFLGEANVSIEFSGRKLSKEEEKELLDIILNESHLSISAERKPKKKEVVKKISETAVEKVISASHNYTMFYKGAVRSGQVVQYAGSIVVVGDVNFGGEVIAEGNIIILGSLNGLVHSGCGGNTECFVSALYMNPSQIRIANVLSYFPSETKKKKKKLEPSYAYIQDGQIYVNLL